MVKYTICIYRAPTSFTNQWNQVPTGWTSMVRGTFDTEQAACERAREILPHGAPFSIRPILDDADHERELHAEGVADVKRRRHEMTSDIIDE